MAAEKEIKRNPHPDFKKVEASRQLRRGCAARWVGDMVGPRYDVSGTSQRTSLTMRFEQLR